MMTTPIEAILAARAANPTMGTRKIVQLVGSSDGTVRRVLGGKLPREVIKTTRGPAPYAGKVK